MGIEFEDKTGRVVSLEGVLEAKAAALKLMLHITTLPPAMGVQIPNIVRCLTEMEAVKEAVEKRKG